MQEISLKNYNTVFSSAAMKAAEKFIVRECDEMDKGQFVAYVDKGNDTFDVSLTIQSNKVKSHDCDCPNREMFCEHKIALLVHIAENKKIVQPKIKTRKKATELDLLFDTIDTDQLIAWTKNLLSQNKDLALSFIHHFKTPDQNITPKESEELTIKAWKAVANNKKKVDLTQLKKIIALWETSHAPILKQYLANVADKESFLCIETVINTCLIYDSSLDINTNKIIKYVESLLGKSVETITSLQNDEVWESSVNIFVEKIPVQIAQNRFYFLNHLLALIEVSTPEKRKIILEKLILQYKKYKSQTRYVNQPFVHLVFEEMLKHKMFDQYYEHFEPYPYDNDYNIKLIEQLLQMEKFTIAERYCKKLIENNYKDTYNVPYWLLLKKLYTQTNNAKGKLEIAKELLPYTFDFEDYQLVYNSFTDTEAQKKWRSKILSKAKNEYYHKSRAMNLYFNILDMDKKYLMMIDNLRYASKKIILQYLDKMVAADKKKFLFTLLESYDTHYRYFESEENDGTVTENPDDLMYEKIISHYDDQSLKPAIQKLVNNRWYMPGKFVNLLKHKLKITD